MPDMSIFMQYENYRKNMMFRDGENDPDYYSHLDEPKNELPQPADGLTAAIDQLLMPYSRLWTPIQEISMQLTLENQFDIAPFTH